MGFRRENIHDSSSPTTMYAIIETVIISDLIITSYVQSGINEFVQSEINDSLFRVKYMSCSEWEIP